MEFILNKRFFLTCMILVLYILALPIIANRYFFSPISNKETLFLGSKENVQIAKDVYESLEDDYKTNLKYVCVTNNKWMYNWLTFSINKKGSFEGLTAINRNESKKYGSGIKVYIEKGCSKDINGKLASDSLVTIFTLSHEFRHVFQYNKGILTPSSYVKYTKKNYKAYLNQDYEIDADNFANKHINESPMLRKYFEGVETFKVNRYLEEE